MRVLELPPSLGYRDVEVLYRAVAAGEPTLFDARRVEWVHPTGMLALLAAGKVARDQSGVASKLTLPEGQKGQQVTSYLSAAGFFRAASGVFDLPLAPPLRRPRRPADTLLEITPITTNSDVHKVVEHIRVRAAVVLERLRYPDSALVAFSVVLSEVCQNIVEHADGPGWVAAQSYKRMPGLPRAAVVVAVSDLGRGFQASLAERHASRFADRWGDVTALEAAFHLGKTRFADTGRGQGIMQIRRQIGRWDGLYSVRSGTARIADAPSWERTPPMEEQLTPFPGAHINIVIPDRIDHDHALHRDPTHRTVTPTHRTMTGRAAS